MYEIFQRLLEERGIKTSKVSEETGIASSTFTDWKMGRSSPKLDKLHKIADYFGVSLDYLMTGKEPAVEETFGTEYAHLVRKITNDTELSKALLKYFELPDTKKKHVVELINLLSE